MAGLSPFDPDRAALRAGRLLLSLIDEAVARRESFTVETTLSGHGYARSIPQWQADGYFVTLISAEVASALALPDVETAIARVEDRLAEVPLGALRSERSSHGFPADAVADLARA